MCEGDGWRKRRDGGRKPLKWMAGLRKAANRQTAAEREWMERESGARSKGYYDTRQEDWDR
jgi:hypothetical protein